MSDRLFPSLRGQGMIGIDVETYDPDILELGPGAHRDGYLVGVSVATEKGFSGYFPVAHKPGGNLPKEKVFKWLNQELSTDVPKVGANLFYDLTFLSASGVKVKGPFYDIQIAEPLLDETLFTYSLESLSQRYLRRGKTGEKMKKWIMKNFGVKEKGVPFHIWEAPPNVVREYGIGDVENPIGIFKKQKAKLEHEGLWDLFILESKLIPMLLAMRERGVCVDLKRAELLYNDMSKRQNLMLSQIKRETGFLISPWNARDIAKIFDQKNLKYPRTAKTKAPSFTKNWLEHHQHPIAQKIQEIRHLDKLKETFVRGVVLESSYKGRIFCQFNQLRSDVGGTISGRFSSSKPNLQQIPIRSEDGKLIRQLFIPEEGKRWFKNDWSQIEYRLLANDASVLKLKGADEVIRRYKKDPGTDFHQIIADMTGLDRASAKTLNFGIAYGEGAHKLARSLGVNVMEGSRILREYHKRTPFMKPLSRHYMALASIDGVVETILGRRRHFNLWERTEWNGKRTFHKERVAGSQRAFAHAALNARIQGSAADIMKSAMVQIWESGVCDVLGAPHLIVHDEVDGSYENNKISREALKEVKHIMETCMDEVYPLRVPLLVDAGTGKNWGDVK